VPVVQLRFRCHGTGYRVIAAELILLALHLTVESVLLQVRRFRVDFAEAPGHISKGLQYLVLSLASDIIHPSRVECGRRCARQAQTHCLITDSKPDHQTAKSPKGLDSSVTRLTRSGRATTMMGFPARTRRSGMALGLRLHARALMVHDVVGSFCTQ